MVHQTIIHAAQLSNQTLSCLGSEQFTTILAHAVALGIVKAGVARMHSTFKPSYSDSDENGPDAAGPSSDQGGTSGPGGSSLD